MTVFGPKILILYSFHFFDINEFLVKNREDFETFSF